MEIRGSPPSPPFYQCRFIPEYRSSIRTQRAGRFLASRLPFSPRPIKHLDRAGEAQQQLELQIILGPVEWSCHNSLPIPSKGAFIYRGRYYPHVSSSIRGIRKNLTNILVDGVIQGGQFRNEKRRSVCEVLKTGAIAVGPVAARVPRSQGLPVQPLCFR